MKIMETYEKPHRQRAGERASAPSPSPRFATQLLFRSSYLFLHFPTSPYICQLFLTLFLLVRLFKHFQAFSCIFLPCQCLFILLHTSSCLFLTFPMYLYLLYRPYLSLVKAKQQNALKILKVVKVSFEKQLLFSKLALAKGTFSYLFLLVRTVFRLFHTLGKCRKRFEKV